MTHPDEDTLLRHVLDLVDPDERSELDAHLAACGECREYRARLERDTDLLGGLEPEIEAPALEMLRPGTPAAPRRWRGTRRLIRIAALLLAGFAAGYGASWLTRSADVDVIPRLRSIRAPAPSVGRFVVCESADIARP